MITGLSGCYVNYGILCVFSQVGLKYCNRLILAVDLKNFTCFLTVPIGILVIYCQNDKNMKHDKWDPMT